MTTDNTTRSEADVYFDKYAESHQNKTNKLIHWICVPAIVFSLLGLVWSIPVPLFFPTYLNWATFVIAFSLYYYFRLSPALAISMLVVTGLMSYLIVKIEMTYGIPMLRWICLGVFVLAWIFQFVGHKIEGKKPSFLDDVKFLLIGPIWLLHFIFKKLGIPY